jgi:ribosome-associated protein
MAQRLRVTPDCEIPISEIDWSFGPSGGPGGQHANRAHSRAEARFDVAGSPSLDESQRERLLRRLGPVVVVTADDSRSQHRNRGHALDRLRDLLADALRPEVPRRPTRPTAASRRRRLEDKRRRGELKRSRRPPGDD